MDEYIKRESAIKYLLNDSPGQVSYSREDAADCIRYMDAADVAPVRHGQWVLVEESPDGDIYECQWCGRLVTNRFSYCHCCGAKMDGGDPT